MTEEWKINYNIPGPPDVFLQAGYPPLLAYVLAVRGISGPEQAKQRYFCGRESILDPFSILNMDKAVSRILEAVENQEKVAVYGDYDVDGITSTCLLTDYLRSKGLAVQPYIPDRTGEGYGLNCSALEQFARDGITLVITVDCGITAVEETAYGNTLGIDIIITDHHECRPGRLPDALAVIDCKQPQDSYPAPFLAGVGVTFKLVCACEGDTDRILDRYADLVAIGTIADVMPLIGENRYIVNIGLDRLRTSPRPGLEAVMREARIRPSAVSASVIGYSIAPRLNAAGRISRALSAGELIMSTDTETIVALTEELCEMNRKRQDIENGIWKEAGKMVEFEDPEGPIVLASDRWHQGVIGIAASRLAEHFGRPTVMINLNGETGKGSCRSYGSFNLFDALSACSEYLVSFGGHALAAGLNIRADRIDEFKAALKTYYTEHRPESQPEVVCDLLITDVSLLDADNIRALNSLEPFGNRNPRPTLCMTDVLVERVQSAGNGKNLRLIINASGLHFNCICFGRSQKELGLKEDDSIDIAFTPQISDYRGTISTQLQVSGVRRHSSCELCRNILEEGATYTKALVRYMPSRQDFVRVWNVLCRKDCLGETVNSVLSVCPPDMAEETYCICLEVFREAGLLSGNSAGNAECSTSGSSTAGASTDRNCTVGSSTDRSSTAGSSTDGSSTDGSSTDGSITAETGSSMACISTAEVNSAESGTGGIVPGCSKGGSGSMFGSSCGGTVYGTHRVRTEGKVNLEETPLMRRLRECR